MPRFDFKCPTCDKLFLDQHVSLSRIHRNDYAGYVCDDCHVQLLRLPAAPSFFIKGYSAKNGYSK